MALRSGAARERRVVSCRVVSCRPAVADLSPQGGFCTRWPVLPSLLPQRLREGSRRSCSPGGHSRRHRQDKAGRGNRNCTCVLPERGILGRVLQTRGEEEPRRTLRCPLPTRRSSAPSVASLSQRLPSPCGSLTGSRGVSTSSCWEGNRRGKAGTRLCFAARECELRAERGRQPSPPRQLRLQRLTGTQRLSTSREGSATGPHPVPPATPAPDVLYDRHSARARRLFQRAGGSSRQDKASQERSPRGKRCFQAS